MSDETVVLSLRLPKPLRDQLRKLADTEHRSLNGQIVTMLTKAIEPKMKAARR